MGWGKSRQAARQMVNHGHITVNGEKVDIASYRVRVGEVVAVKENDKKIKLFEGVSERISKADLPSWISVDAEKLSGKILNVPVLDNAGFNAKAIIEFYSR